MRQSREITTKNMRHSNFDLLRILAMFMIVIYHIVCHCVTVQITNPASLGRETIDVFNHPIFYKKLLIINSLETFGIIGNAIFIMICGYFMANRKFEYVKLGSISKKLLLQQWFAVAILVCGSPILHKIIPDFFVYMPSITFFNNMAWFVGYYLIVVICGSLFLNNFLEKLNSKQFVAFLITLFAFVQFDYSGGFASGLTSNLRTVLTGIFLYSLGGFIKKFDPFKNIRFYFLILIIIAVYVLIWISGYNLTATSIETYIRNSSEVPFIQSFPSFENHSIVIMIISVSLFEIFHRIRLPENKFISFIGKSTFMIYLLHDNTLFYELWNFQDWVTLLSVNPMSFIFKLLEYAIFTFVIGVIAYVIFTLLKIILNKCKKIIIK